MPFGNDERAQAGPISLRKPLRRPEKRRDGDLSAEPRDPTTSPHGDFGALATLFRLTRARPAPQVFFAKRPDLRSRRRTSSEGIRLQTDDKVRERRSLTLACPLSLVPCPLSLVPCPLSL